MAIIGVNYLHWEDFVSYVWRNGEDSFGSAPWSPAAISRWCLPAFDKPTLIINTSADSSNPYENITITLVHPRTSLAASTSFSPALADKPRTRWRGSLSLTSIQVPRDPLVSSSTQSIELFQLMENIYPLISLSFSLEEACLLLDQRNTSLLIPRELPHKLSKQLFFHP